MNFNVTLWRGYAEVINVVNSAPMLNVFDVVYLVTTVPAVAFRFRCKR